MDPGYTLPSDDAPRPRRGPGYACQRHGGGAPLSYDCASGICSNSNLFRSIKIRTLSRNESRAYALHSANSVVAMTEYSCAFNARQHKKNLQRTPACGNMTSFSSNNDRCRYPCRARTEAYQTRANKTISRCSEIRERTFRMHVTGTEY